jgi:acetoacetyl-CoA synthetase
LENFNQEFSLTKNPLWIPSQKRVSEANITRFINFVNQKHESKLNGYQELYNYSVTDIEKFWEDIFEFADLKVSGEYK